jgi:Uma2 family endonuclease
MPGGSFQHNLISMNAGRELGNRLLRGPCRVLSSDMRIAVNTKSGYVYPDVSVVCGAPGYTDERKDTITNPKLVVEVLSPSTSQYDLGVKLRLYLKLQGLTDVVLVAQDRIWIEYWYRASDGGWKTTVLEDPGSILDIVSLDCKIPLSEIYLGVDLPAAGE